jgi:hypothetical protein
MCDSLAWDLEASEALLPVLRVVGDSVVEIVVEGTVCCADEVKGFLLISGEISQERVNVQARMGVGKASHNGGYPLGQCQEELEVVPWGTILEPLFEVVCDYVEWLEEGVLRVGISVFVVREVCFDKQFGNMEGGAVGILEDLIQDQLERLARDELVVVVSLDEFVDGQHWVGAAARRHSGVYRAQMVYV